MRRVLAVIIAAACVSGCQQMEIDRAAQQRIDRMKVFLEPFVGKTVADYALAFGPPQTSFDVSPGKKAFQWETISHSVGMAMLLPGTSMIVSRGPEEQSCRISFVAASTKTNPSLGNWVIEHYRWQGFC